MKTLNLFYLSIALFFFPFSSAVYAADGGDRTFARAMHQNSKSMELYAARNGKEAPVVENYRYGMKLDISKVINITPPIQDCGVVPSRMTYENSAGQLKTVEYSIMGNCRLNGG